MRLAIQRICVPTDFSEAADHAVHYAAALAHTYRAALHLVHVIEHAGPLVHHPDFSATGEVARAYLNQLERAVAEAQQMEPAEPVPTPEVPELIETIKVGAVQQIDALGDQWWSGLEVHRDIRYGHPVKEINHYVEHVQADLVVMGTHGHSKLAAVLLGSVTERVVRTCPCPVTVIRHPEHQYQLLEDTE